MVRHGSGLAGLKRRDLAAERAFVAEIFSRETGVHDRDGLLRVAVFDREIATFENLQPRVVK